MRFPISHALLSHILLVFFIIFAAAAQTTTSQLCLHHPLLYLPPSESKPATSLFAALDGTMYLVESSSGRVIWSFSTGSPIYHSYQASPVTINTSGVVECGDDWELILHHNRIGKTRLSETIADYVALTPIITEDGVVILGSKRSTVFEVDAKTGRVIRHYAAADFDSAFGGWSDDGKNVTTSHGIRNNELADPAKLNSTEFLLKIFRTDYFLQTVGPKSGMVLCTMAVAEFKAVLLCQPDKNPSSRASLDAERQYASDSALDFAMPYACHDEKLKEVYRQRKNFLLEPHNPERFSGDYQESDTIPMLSSDLMLPPQPNIDGFLPVPDSMMLIPAPAPNYLPSLLPKIDFCHSKDNAAVLSPLPMERIASEKVDLGKVFEWSAALPLTLFVVFLLGSFIFYQHKVKSRNQNSESNLKCLPSKKKRKRKSRKNTVTVDKKDKYLSSTVKGDRQDNYLSSTEEDVMTNEVDGRKIGKLVVLNEEIAKGSNGTIVLAGSFENRKVAVKRIVRAYHDVADKEMNILAEHDNHPNIVRFYGMEFDQDFVYLALERCSCSLDDMIQKYSDKDDTQYLWKANGHPSSLLLKLMRGIVFGLVHLHELRIIHRDLKPQNILIDSKDQSCAKLSDMGISKHLPNDVSSFGYSAAGCGSSGWRAPELLTPGACQTRAVDLFSLGCVLFFLHDRGKASIWGSP